VDVRAQLDRYAAPHTVGWHVACVTNRWTRRALASAGFGYPKSSSTHVWKPILSVADVVTNEDAQHDKKKDDVEHQQTLAGDDITQHIISEKSQVSVEEKGAVILSGKAPLYGVNRPFFHVDVVSALESAAAALEASVSEKVQAESKEE
jgi:sodium-independent sulfate anion transporter 11